LEWREERDLSPLSSPSLLPIPSDETINFLAAIPALYTVYKNLHNRVNGPVGKNLHMEDSIRSRDGDTQKKEGNYNYNT
jgi:hypothetical protein